MRILTVCSGLDFINYTRRATIEAIHGVNPEMDILLFNSILNIRKKKKVSDKIKFFNYHFWIVEKLRKIKGLPFLEYCLRFIKWESFFKKYEIIFFIDPNQYYLLPFLTRKHKLVYLLRDPSILLDPNNYSKELKVIARADLILAISENLSGYYFEKYYGFKPENVKLWPNTVDLGLWNYSRWESNIRQKTRPLIGLAGNIDFVVDLELLKFVIECLPQYDFEIAGKLDTDSIDQVLWHSLLDLPNIKYLGFIPYDEFPATVINWDIGLVAAKQDNEYARYLNNNKQFQYLALGKPFVTYRLNADYAEFIDLVYIADSKLDYLEKIHDAIGKTREKGVIEKGRKIADINSAEARACTFIKYLELL